VFEHRSPLAAHLTAGGRDGADGRRALRIGEVGGWQLLQIGVFSGSRAAVEAAVEKACGCTLPTSPRFVTASGAHRLYRVAEDQYWLLTRDPAVPPALARTIAPQAAAITTLGHARIRLVIEGPAATALLARLVTIDLRYAEFPAGSFAQTGVHHAGVLLERIGAERYEMYVLRTYALSTWEWIVDAAKPYGYDLAAAHAGTRTIS
jgi:methylglutamate dehydrogenase subunit D